ncbi:nucleoside-diphosphate kinase [Tubulinosema ratisbonensis]|uniref:Nucleoside diphosphate kinase n=1 Tax=Tubulinosema ratisbonensis TaxID=291195 RepID=A0A437AKZ8_9MICR|nr:nucleoside-diphosphate kinase [Tubulinosema ratisbonensis]
MERTFIMLKPEAIKRRLIGELISKFEKVGYTVECIKSLLPTKEIVQKHYSEHLSKKFYPSLESSITSGMVVCLIVSGKNVVENCRKIIGATDPMKSAPGTIRGDYAVDLGRNVIHGSDSKESAEREIGIWFGEIKTERVLFDHELIYE